jgi:hypothetical protein
MIRNGSIAGLIFFSSFGCFANPLPHLGDPGPLPGRSKPAIGVPNGAEIASRLEAMLKAKTGMDVRYDPTTLQVMSVTAKGGEQVRFIPSTSFNGATRFNQVFVAKNSGEQRAALHSGCVADRLSPEPCEDEDLGASYEAALDEALPMVRPLSNKLETVVVTGRRATHESFWHEEFNGFIDQFYRDHGESGGGGGGGDPDPTPDPVCIANRVTCIGAAETIYATGTSTCARNWQADSQRAGLNRGKQIVAAAKAAYCQGTVEAAKAAALSVCPECK